jgi:tetratricopeptide (TPR) repeat protein
LVRTARFFAVSLTLALALGASAQAWKGMARIQGTIVDAAGKPVKGARVILKSVRDNAGPQPIVTDDRGRWAALGLAGGNWNLDVEAEGFLPKATSVQLSELNRLPAMKIELEAAPPPAPKEEAAPVQVETIQVGGVAITPETAAALEAANAFMKEQKWKEAAAEYEKAVAVLTTNVPLRFALSRAYHGAGEVPKAIEHLQVVYAADSGNVTAATLLADMLLETGKVDDAKKVLAALPPGAISDVDTIINLGIRFTNQNLPEDAFRYFNDAVALAPDVAAAYYYRGIANLQLKKMKEAKADLNKVVELAPDAPEAKDAKDLLAQMK